MQKDSRHHDLIWIDLEMTGLDTDRDYIIEVATVVTDSELDIIAEGPVLAVHQPEAVLQGMDEWNTEQHNKSGLVGRVRQSQLSVVDAESITLEFLAPLVPARGSPMCGNSICQDRRFLHRLMPKLERYFHYRNLDVSSIKELAKLWYPEVRTFSKQSEHLALADIYESINELKYYRQKIFARPSAVS